MVKQRQQPFAIVGGLLRQGDSVLLVKQQKPDDPEPRWALPGEYVEREESLLDALHREMREETGLDVLQIGPLLYVIHLIVQDTRVAFVALVFQIDAWCGQLQPSVPLFDAVETILDAQFGTIGQATKYLEQGL